MMLRFVITDDDLLAFQEYYKQSPAVRRKKKNYVLFFSLFIFGCAVLYPMEDLTGRYVLVGIGALVALSSYLQSSETFDEDVEKTLREVYFEWHDMTGEVELTIDQEGISEQREIGSRHSTWEEVQEIVETDDYCYILYSPPMAYVVPRHSVHTGFVDQFMDQAKEYWLAAHPQKSVES